MTVLITGSKGFIGYWLCKELRDLGYEIITLDRNQGDLATDSGKNLLESLEFDHVFHLAASGTIVESWNRIPEYIRSIDVGTAQVLERCRAIGAAYTYVSSYMYGMPHYIPIDEAHPLDTVNPYALAKRLSEQICEFYSKQFDIKGTIIRPFGLFGPGQKRDFVVPTVLFQILENEEVWVNDLTPNKRDHLYIKDFISLLVRTISPSYNFEIFNAAYGDSFTVEELTQVIQKVTGTNKALKSRDNKRRNEYTHLYASREKAKNLLNWEPRYDLHTAIEDYLKEIQAEQKK